ncbi:MAG: hybrid sensor histidine kinase/response regulator [Candidatus Omnitrophica bacterium]|nr:hybrid sensor histidine kinase/response regulator [Candidatus Omnitrophota bacterium]
MKREVQLLVLDDEANILNALSRVFRDEPYQMLGTTSPDEALKILKEKNIKVVVSDQRMPLISGIDFLKKAKENKSDVIRILFTGFADIQVAEDAINQNQVYRFIEKPWNDEQLKAAIREGINHYDLVEENRRLLGITKKQNEELEIANGKLKQMFERQREFTSTVSHELRTPLAAIKTAIDIILMGLKGQVVPGQVECLDIAKKNVDRLARLINNILTLSKLESGMESLEMNEADINEILREVAETQTLVAKKNNLFLKLELDPRLQKFHFNLDRMNQVISNLVNNAIKFTGQGGIILSSRMDDRHQKVEIRIKDTGPGISEEDRPKLFQKFKQLGDNSGKHYGGTGLGLAICKEIVQQHGGEIRVESAVGAGSEFIISLPFTTTVEEVRKAA